MNDHAQIHYNKAFGLAVCLNIGFVAFEAAFGILANSTALLADAGHNLGDVLGLLLAWGAQVLSTRGSSRRRTYGWKSTTIMAALINAVILFFAVAGIAWEAIHRFVNPRPVSGVTMIYVAAIGVVINTATALFFVSGQQKDLNIRSAFLHMAADAGVSLGVVAAGVGIMITGRLWIDPVISLVIGGIILVGTWGLLRDSVNLVLHAVPAEIDLREVSSYLLNVPGVKAVHDLHIWAMSTAETALTAHVVKPILENDDAMLTRIDAELQERFGIDHVTVQVERSNILNRCRNECKLEETKP